MTIDERQRHELYSRQRVEASIGANAADTLMAMLPPVGWADVATKPDLDALRAYVDARFDQVDARFDRVEARFELVDARVV